MLTQKPQPAEEPDERRPPTRERGSFSPIARRRSRGRRGAEGARARASRPTKMRKRRCRKRFTLGHVLRDRDRAALSSPVDVPTIGDSEHENRTVRSVDLENDEVRADAQSPRLLAADTPTVDVRQLAQFAIGSRRKVDAPGRRQLARARRGPHRRAARRRRGARRAIPRGRRVRRVRLGVPSALRFDAGPDTIGNAPIAAFSAPRARPGRRCARATRRARRKRGSAGVANHGLSDKEARAAAPVAACI